MANVYTSLADLVKINDKNLKDILVTDLLQDAPLMAALAADIASNGTSHKYLKETGAVTVGFRSPNVGLENKASADTLVSIDLKILDASFACDKALADAYFKGPEAYLQREALRHLKAAFFEAEKQFINGTGNSADGFTGLADAISTGHAMLIDAGGSDDGGGSGGDAGDTGLSSVYLVRTRDDGTEVTVITGQNGEITIDESVVQRLESSTGLYYTGYHTPIQGWLGLQVGSAKSVGRIANLGASANKLTDDLIYEALSKFPASRQPNKIVMNNRSLFQLRDSRTATNATGAPVPIPAEVAGIPIVNTDAIGIDEDEV